MQNIIVLYNHHHWTENNTAVALHSIAVKLTAGKEIKCECFYERNVAAVVTVQVWTVCARK